MKRGWRTLVPRVSGFSTPVFGLQWEPPTPERDLARRLVAFLENRRVLFVEGEAEIPDHAARSVIEIRAFLTDIIQEAPAGSKVEAAARQMRAACLAFHRGASSSSDMLEFGVERGHWASWVFLQSLGLLRAHIGTQLAIVIAAYGVDVEDHLLSILPPDAREVDEASDVGRGWGR